WTERPLVEDGLGGPLDERVEVLEQAAEDDEPRVQDVDEASQAEPEPAGRLLERRERDRVPIGRGGQERVDLGAAPVGRPSGASEQGGGTDLGLPAARRPAAAGPPVRVDRHVADLAAVAGDTREGAAADDDPATDTDLARDVQNVVDAPGGAPADLGQGPEVGVVGDLERDPEAQGGIEALAERDVAPAEVGRHPDEPVGSTDDARHGHADPDDGAPPAARDEDALGQADEVRDDRIERDVVTR